MKTVFLSCTWAFCAFIVVACGGSNTGSGAAAPTRGPEALNQKSCGACHAPFASGQHTVAQLEPIMKKHRDEKRATLSDDEWKSLSDYLAKK